jgi:phosphoserine phosphatase RsbU/P
MKPASSLVIADASHVIIPSASFRLAQASILVVDDMALNVQLISTALSKAGFCNIYSAENGEVALEKTRILNPDLVILDLLMPKVDGFGYCTTARNDPTIPYMPIIVQTMVSDRETKLRALSCGADDFLYKPLDPAELILRACIHLERYFMLQDIQNAHQCLKIELEDAQSTREEMEKASVPPFMINRLNRHYEVLEQMTCVSPFAS